jgi:hypothetical protein
MPIRTLAAENSIFPTVVLRCVAPLAILVALGGASDALAQRPKTPRPLAGLKVIDVAAVPLRKEASLCGVKNELVESAAKKELQKSRVRVTSVEQSEAGIVFFIRAFPLDKDQCVLLYEAALKAPGELDALFGKSSGVYTLWSNSGVNVIQKPGVPRAVEIAVRDLVADFVREWSEQN